MILGIDIDNTINTLSSAWISRLNHRFNLNPYVKMSDIKEWSMFKAFPMLTHEQVISPLIEDNLWRKLIPFPDSQEYLKILNDEHEIYLVTSTDYRNFKVKMEWLQEYFPFIKPEQVIVAHKKQLINVDVMIDDYEQNLIGGKYEGLLLNYPWNQNFNEKDFNIVRVNNWQEVFDEIKLIEYIKDRQRGD